MQSTNRILMVRPQNFFFNEETAEDNLYQNEPKENKDTISKKALEEFDKAVEIIKNKNIEVNIIEDNFNPYTPDSIFPNNWFSTHNGLLILYPMYAENRRKEVFKFKDKLINIYKPKKIIDLRDEGFRKEQYLESTGAMIFDRVNKKIYASLSERSNEDLIKELGNILDYRTFIFKSHQLNTPIYHTNVLMSITSDFAFVALDLIDEEYRNEVYESLKEDRKVINLNSQNILDFCANVLELNDNKGKKYLMMSDTSYKSLDKKILETIEEKLEIIHVDVSTIERIGGGSIRCMIGELF